MFRLFGFCLGSFGLALRYIGLIIILYRALACRALLASALRRIAPPLIRG